MPGSLGRVNRVHHLYCASSHWARRAEHKLMPWALDGVDLGDDVLEVGPGLGATTRVLARRPGRLSVIELEQRSAQRLRSEFAPGVDVLQGDATAMALPDGRFSGVACFTMLHHLPSAELQDRLLVEACRVLRPGGVLAGSDSLGGSFVFWLFHITDTFVRVAPEGLAARLKRAGFVEPRVRAVKSSVRFTARKPG
jgi:SAM-dependent methyltransferase